MKQTLTSHVRIVHEKEKHQHFCSVCGKKFANRTLAAKHEEVVHFSKEPPEQGNLLKGIVSLLDVAQYVVQVRYKVPDNSLFNNFSLFEIKSLEELTKKVAQCKTNHKNEKTSCQIVLFSTKTIILNSFVSL